METIIPAVFDNRHEKRKWIAIPIIFIVVVFGCIFLPIMIFVELNSDIIVVTFILIVLVSMTLVLWYHITVPSHVILDHHFLVLEKVMKREAIPLDLIIRAKKISNGVLFLKMANGKQIFRSGIDNMIMYHIMKYIGIRNNNRI